MGGVDIADQLRGYYGTQLPVRRTWMPLFFWLLDTALVNSYLILKKVNTNINHKDFRLQIIWDLIEESLKESEKKPHTRNQVDELTNQFKFIYVDPTKKQQYVTTKYELPIIRLFPEGHYPEWRETRSSCVWCKYLVKKNQEKAAKNPPQSQLYCIKCDLALCCNKERSNCFKDFHTYREDDD
ncbi:piggyBac transposable element-derived protein 4-like [Rhizophagus clarus]|uniref:PiggyBac transposable element-derived protein 4-like n=1 Tax=Rhizophagus clarus TaxID=94130 RepID=A0A8H3QF28_9GLOM|nr:piggyBac transposable element-derived protein 4-like [Rhizophagus clarus]